MYDVWVRLREDKSCSSGGTRQAVAEKKENHSFVLRNYWLLGPWRFSHEKTRNNRPGRWVHCSRYRRIHSWIIRANYFPVTKNIKLSLYHIPWLLRGFIMKCTHTDQIRDVQPRTKGCEECLQTNDTWVHLRMCLTCGHVGCCDSSKNRHATKHFQETGHPIMQSIEQGENWKWCYVDKIYLK